jgi:hypothetical protein
VSGSGKSTTACGAAPHERLVHVLAQFAREDDDAVVVLDALQQVADLDVGVAVVRVPVGVRRPNSASASSMSRTALLACAPSKTRPKVVLGLADVLAHRRRQVDPVEVEPSSPPRRPSRAQRAPVMPSERSDSRR